MIIIKTLMTDDSPNQAWAMAGSRSKTAAGCPSNPSPLVTQVTQNKSETPPLGHASDQTAGKTLPCRTTTAAHCRTAGGV